MFWNEFNISYHLFLREASSRLGFFDDCICLMGWVELGWVAHTHQGALLTLAQLIKTQWKGLGQERDREISYHLPWQAKHGDLAEIDFNYCQLISD